MVGRRLPLPADARNQERLPRERCTGVVRATCGPWSHPVDATRVSRPDEEASWPRSTAPATTGSPGCGRRWSASSTATSWGRRSPSTCDGETVVDLWGGHRDEDRTTPWTEDTIVNVWSTTKSRALARGADAGRPRRARRRTRRSATTGRSSRPRARRTARVRHLMSHTSGVSGWDPPFSIKDMYDWETSTERLAVQRPWWEPGTASGYHAQQPGAPGRRGDPADHHKTSQAVRRRRDRRPARRGLPDRRPPSRDWDRIAPVVPPAAAADRPARSTRQPGRVKTFTGPVASPKAANSPAGGRPTSAR